MPSMLISGNESCAHDIVIEPLHCRAWDHATDLAVALGINSVIFVRRPESVVVNPLRTHGCADSEARVCTDDIVHPRADHASMRKFTIDNPDVVTRASVSSLVSEFSKKRCPRAIFRMLSFVAHRVPPAHLTSNIHAHLRLGIELSLHYSSNRDARVAISVKQYGAVRATASYANPMSYTPFALGR